MPTNPTTPPIPIEPTIPSTQPQGSSSAALPPALARHAAQLLTGTGITPTGAVDAARGTPVAASTPAATALRDGWAAAQCLPCLHTAGSSAVEWYDLGQRLYAHTSRTVASRLARTPIPHVPHPIAVRAHQHRNTVTVAIATPTTPDDAATPTTTVPTPATTAETATGTDALDLLHRHGVRITAPTWRTLVTDDPRTIPSLERLARQAPRDGTRADTAAHLAWWIDRSDFPGTSAVIDLTRSCATRWITGSTPDAEQHAETWRKWLQIVGDHPATMLAVLDRLQAGPNLSGIDTITEDDAWSWRFAQNDHANGLDWRTPDSIGRAASGLRVRCDIADTYAAALLTDPLYRRRAVHSGHVATGTVVIDRPDARRTSVTYDRLDVRLRAGDAVLGWVGPPDGSTAQQRWNGTLTDTSVVGTTLILSFTVVGAQRPSDGDSVTVMPAPPNPNMMRSGRNRYRRLYGARRSWLSTGRPPTIARRDVPLDILFAPGND